LEQGIGGVGEGWGGEGYDGRGDPPLSARGDLPGGLGKAQRGARGVGGGGLELGGEGLELGGLTLAANGRKEEITSEETLKS
jgi:hypothetical protein